MLNKILDWKLWVVIGAILSVISGLKIRGDHYKDKADDAKDALIGAEAEGSIREFEAAQKPRQTAAQREIARLKEEQDVIQNNADDDITTAVR